MLMKKVTRSLLIVLATVGFVNGSMAHGSLLVSDSGGFANIGYGYSAWATFTQLLQNAAAGNVSVVNRLDNLNQLLSSDALLLDQRWFNGSLTDTEIANVKSFIATGRRAVLFGENSMWAAWDQQILSLVDGQYGGEYNGPSAVTAAQHQLTDGVDSLWTSASGLAAPSSASLSLFNPGVAVLWGNDLNVLTILDVALVEDFSFYWGHDNQRFASNVAAWLMAPVPEPSSQVLAWLLIGAGASVRGRRRR